MINEQDFINEVIRLCSKSVNRKQVNNTTDVLGLALFNLGQREAFDSNLRTKDILHKFFGFSRETSYWADKIQYYQDIGLSWERAIFETNCFLVRKMLNEGIESV